MGEVWAELLTPPTQIQHYNSFQNSGWPIRVLFPGPPGHPLHANNAVAVFLPKKDLSVVWGPATRSAQWLSRVLKKKPKTEVTWLGIFALKKKINGMS